MRNHVVYYVHECITSQRHSIFKRERSSAHASKDRQCFVASHFPEFGSVVIDIRSVVIELTYIAFA